MKEIRQKLKLYSVQKDELAQGIFLILLSLLMPMALQPLVWVVLYYNQLALADLDKLALFGDAFLLVLLNALQSLPRYTGVYLVADSLVFRVEQKDAWTINASMVLVMVFCLYPIMDLMYNVHYDFGIPAYLTAIIIVLFDKMNFKYVSRLKRVTFICMVLILAQILDIMPCAAALPVGRGELAVNIRMSVQAMDMETPLNVGAILLFLLFVVFAILFWLLLRDENQLREMELLRRQNEVIRAEAREKELQNRSYKEMQHLVHDLKSPLTVLQTFTGVLKMKSGPEDTEIFERMERAEDMLNGMISEILYANKANPIATARILKRMSAQLSIEEYANNITYKNSIPDAHIRVNSILFTRALVNLVQNGAKAVPKEREKQLEVSVYSEEGCVCFSVKDNGMGIPQEKREKIWDSGYSGTNSSGLGLSFVKSVVEQANGSIQIKNTVDTGTEFLISLSEVQDGI